MQETHTITHSNNKTSPARFRIKAGKAVHYLNSPLFLSSSFHFLFLPESLREIDSRAECLVTTSLVHFMSNKTSKHIRLVVIKHYLIKPMTV